MIPLKCFFPLALLVACTDKSTTDDETTEDGSAAVNMSAEWYYSFGYDGAPSLDCAAYYKSMPAVNSTLCPDCDVVGFVQYDYEEGTCNDGECGCAAACCCLKDGHGVDVCELWRVRQILPNCQS